MRNVPSMFRFLTLPPPAQDNQYPKAGAAAAAAQDVTPTASGTTYVYTLKCTGSTPPSPITLKLAVNSAFLPVVITDPKLTDSTSKVVITPQNDLTQGVTVTYSKLEAGKNYMFSITAQNNLSSGPVEAGYSITYPKSANIAPVQSQIQVPAFTTPDEITGLAPVASDESKVDVLAGLGAHIALSSFPDYTIATNSVLVSTGVGHAIPELLLGAGFTTGANKILGPGPHGFGKNLGRHLVPDSIFVNAQLPVGSDLSSSGSVSGFTFGGGYKVQRYLEILVGFSLAQTNDPSVGFHNAAAAIVAANAKLTPSTGQVPLYLQYAASEILKDKAGALDGFPLLLQTPGGTPGGPIYNGTALLNHYVGGLFIGLAYPFSLNKLFQSK